MSPETFNTGDIVHIEETKPTVFGIILEEEGVEVAIEIQLESLVRILREYRAQVAVHYEAEPEEGSSTH